MNDRDCARMLISVAVGPRVMTRVDTRGAKPGALRRAPLPDVDMIAASAACTLLGISAKTYRNMLSKHRDLFPKPWIFRRDPIRLRRALTMQQYAVFRSLFYVYVKD